MILTKGVLPLLKTKVDFLDSYLDNAEKEFTILGKEINSTKGCDVKDYEILLDRIRKQKDKVESFLNLLGNLK